MLAPQSLGMARVVRTSLREDARDAGRFGLSASTASSRADWAKRASNMLANKVYAMARKAFLQAKDAVRAEVADALHKRQLASTAAAAAAGAGEGGAQGGSASASGAAGGSARGGRSTAAAAPDATPSGQGHSLSPAEQRKLLASAGLQLLAALARRQDAPPTAPVSCSRLAPTRAIPGMPSASAAPAVPG
jgi:hypothetical protein